MNALKCRGRAVMGGASSVGAHRGSNGTAAVIPEPGGSGLALGHAAQDHPAVLAGVAGLLDRDLHDLEPGRVGGAPHVYGAVAHESPGGDQLEMARAAVLPGVPALVELALAQPGQVLGGERDVVAVAVMPDHGGG